MITLKKLGELPRSTRLRKISRLLLRLECRLRGLPGPDSNNSPKPDTAYLDGLFSMVAADEKLSASLRERAARCVAWLAAPDRPDVDLARRLSDVRYAIEDYLGHTPADWDFYRCGELDRGERRVENIYLYLDDVRSPFNVGAIFRAADSFGVREIFLSEGCASPTHSRAERSSMGAVSLIAWRRATLEQALAASAATAGTPIGLLAVETGGVALHRFQFPEAGIAVVGSEELGVSADALQRAALSAGRVSIPTAGAKGSLNVAVAAGIVLYQWWQALTR